MIRASTLLVALVALSFLVTDASAADTAKLKEYKACVAKVKKDYPVPPGNVNTRNQMIKQECGKRPKK